MAANVAGRLWNFDDLLAASESISNGITTKPRGLTGGAVHPSIMALVICKTTETFLR